MRDKLPSKIRTKASESYALWSANPNHPSLHFKKIHLTEPIFSVRISLGYRALGSLVDDTMVWFWIGSHTEYDQMISGQ